jgi:DNA-binding MarR family transcriptional regulator
MKIIEAIALLKNACLMNDAEIRKHLHLTPAEFNGLLSIDDSEIVSCQTLSQKMGLSVSRGSRVINKLIDKKYLKGKRLNDDKRCSQISLTKKGMEAKVEIYKTIDDCEKKITSILTKSQVSETKKCLNRLITLLENRNN